MSKEKKQTKKGIVKMVIAAVILMPIITVVVAELAYFILFESLTGQKLDYAELETQRKERIEILEKRLQQDIVKKGVFCFHPYLGYYPRWMVSAFDKNTDIEKVFGGLRFPYKKKADEFVLVVLGGSVAELFTTYADDIEEFLVELNPRFKEKKLVLICLATGAYKQPQQLIHLQYALLTGFEIDAVLNLDGFNDVALAVENMRKGVSFIFPAGWQMSLLTTSFCRCADPKILQTITEIYSYYSEEYRLLKFIQKWPFKYSPYLNMLGARFTNKSINEVKKLNVDLAIESHQNIPPEFRGPELNPAGNEFQSVVDLWEKSSLMIRAICREYNLMYIHVLQPNQYVDGSKPLSEREKECAYEMDNLWAQAAHEGYPYLIAAGKELQAQGVAFYDMTPIFEGVTDDLYIDICCHFNEKGNQILAKAIALAIAQEIKSQKDTLPNIMFYGGKAAQPESNNP